ncbi:MAG: hypothetical protein PHX53_12255 [Syntrophales bacterium]|nr:hypothetical protein [Syntrophales bacterium]
MKPKEPESRELTREEMTEVLRDAHQEILDLQFKLAEYEWVESALRDRTHELSERVKELECLYAISHCLCRSTARLAVMLQDIINILPQGYQNPELTWGKLEISGESYCSHQFRLTPDSHSEDIMIHGKRAGALTVWVSAKPGLEDEPLILPMEKALLQTVSLWIGKTVEHWRETNPEAAPTGWWARTVKRAAALIRSD